MALVGKPAADVEEESLKEVLRLIMVKAGLRAENWPADEEKTLLIAHIIAEYGTHTLAEIRLAFEMAFAGKLDLRSEDVKCYENFSCLYFSQIMNAYRKWAKQEYNELPTAAPPATEPIEDVSDQAMEDWLGYVQERVKGAQCSVEFIPLALYEWKDKKGLILATPEQKREYIGRAVAYRHAQLQEQCEKDTSGTFRGMLAEFEAMKAEGCFKGDVAEGLKNLAKKMITFDLMKNEQ